MTDPAARVVGVLADGRPRGRAALARASGIDEPSLDETLGGLSRLGVAVVVERDTVRLPRPVDLLDADEIRAAVPRLRPGATHVRFAVDSTSTVLAERLRAGAVPPELCAAEVQTAGRGRHGRAWVSAPGGSLVLSVSWRFTGRADELSGLSLAVGVALAEALAGDGLDRVMLKWPNDLVVDDRKLAGVLVEASHARTGAVTCVIGVGFNLDLAPAESDRIDQPWTDFARAFGRAPARSRLAARATNAVLDACERFRDDGMAPFVARWEERDALRDRVVRVQSGGTPVRGVARGIDRDGALLVECAAGVVRCEAGEVRVRVAGT